MRHAQRRSARRGRRVGALAVALVLGSAGCAADGPSSSDPAPTFRGVAYPQRVALPSIPFPATDGRRTPAPTRCAERVCVLALVALRDPASVRLVTELRRVVGTLPAGSTRHFVMLATLDPTHDSISGLTAACRPLGKSCVGLRGTFALTEFAARSLLLDVTPYVPGRQTASALRAVCFRPDGTAAVAWRLDTPHATVVHDLSALVR